LEFRILNLFRISDFGFKDCPMVKASSLRMGKTLCPGYQLRRLRGRGGFGSVWEAENSAGKIVALKFLPCEDALTAAQEIRAIQVVRKLRHPNLLSIHQVWCHKGYIIITMELADGSLQDLLDAYLIEFGTPPDSYEICCYLTQAARVLDFLNRREHVIDGQPMAIQHCDVKPTNLLLFGEKVKLCDFGLSSLTTCTLKHHRRAGTFAYAAPEVFQGRLSDWSDQYALAITYCHLRGGRLPFNDHPKTQSGYVRPAPDLSRLSAEEQRIITRALAPVPQDRWPSCVELMTQLGRALD
jgi:serine/threonine protein kinase